jgi:hypothetical protein
MTDTTEYKEALRAALKNRADWLDKTELPKFKEELRLYHTGSASLYNLYLKKGLIHEDPYKQEVKIGELEIPDASAFSETNRIDELTLRLSAYDNQLDFLVNFYQFSADFLTLERIKKIVGLVRYIDWPHLTPDSQSPVTRAVAEMTNQIKTGVDPLTMSVISESLSHLNKSYAPIMNSLKNLTDYQREAYKLDLRDTVTSQIPPQDAAQIPLLKKKFTQVNPGKPFYPDLAEEVIKEDYTGDGPALHAKILKSLEVTSAKPKAVKPKPDLKVILLEGAQILGNSAQTFSEVAVKINENHILLESKNRGFWQKMKKVVAQMFNKPPEPVFYNVEHIDTARGMPVRERINFSAFKNELERKIRILSSLSPKGPGFNKLESMKDDQIISFLEKNIHEVQGMHKTLTALDEFFKAKAGNEERERIKGIKPELGTIKNVIIRANAKRHEYGAQKEEEEQLKRLGVNPES